ncbi:MAG: BMP family ABC transporter substrate-binding protein [Oscillospiraceae bacterium]|nr:BMP family ABC transporter substrate-binding protein [Oscillospiraceae bacterium]
MAKHDYLEAKKLGDAAVRFALKNGLSAYPPVLDQIEEIKSAAGEVRVGLLELPLSRINGTKEAGRTNVFATNFMPILEGNSEFAIKWAALYDSYVNEGIRDAILVYEYMNQYYVQEGNKRVSVSKYGGSEFILADVIRILPARDDSKESRLYYEYLDFFKSTKNHYIVFSEPGEYERLAEMLGQELGARWDEDLCKDLKAAFFNFSRKCEDVMKDSDDFTMGDAFLIYISIFPMKSLLTDTKDQIVKNIRLARRELLTSVSAEKIDFVEKAPEAAEQKGFMNLFTPSKKYSASSPLRAAFIYDADIESSRWINSHEAGRLYVEGVIGENVRTKSYFTNGDVSAALEQAISDKNEVIFTVAPDMMEEVLKTALHYPKIRFFNCASGKTSNLVKGYHGKLYEAAFLLGIYCGYLTVQEGDKPHRIGYAARTFENTAVVNAFALGVSTMDPACRISLHCLHSADEQEAEAMRESWKAEGISLYADIEYPTLCGIRSKPGIYRMTDGNDIYLGRAYFNWGRYYAQILQAFLSGAWNSADLMDSLIVRNYWFGLSTGVVDVLIPDLPYQTRKMIGFFKDDIANGNFDPFVGEIHAQDGIIQAGNDNSRGSISIDMEKLPLGKVVTMDWLAENIDGMFL